MHPLITLAALLFFWFCSAAAAAFPAMVEDTVPEQAGLIANGGYQVGTENRQGYSYRSGDRFIPASTLKLVTALAALEILGPDYRFETEFHYDRHHRLYLSGSGDPFLTSEELADIAEALALRGITEVSELVLDDRSFQLEGIPPGSSGSANPYEAPSGALCVNFNTLPLTRTETGELLPAEPQTPLLPLMREIGRQLPEGTHRVNVAAFQGPGGADQSLRYAAELFRAKLLDRGIPTSSRYSRGSPNPQARKIYRHRSSRNVAEAVAACLRYSNNFIANQLLLACGATLYGYPATWEKAGRAAVRVLESRIGRRADEITLVDGSGLSRVNRATPRALAAVLRELKPYRHLLPERDGIRIKSGTLSEVYNYAGYFPDSAGSAEFVILLNQTENHRDAVLTRLLHHIRVTGRDAPAGPNRHEDPAPAQSAP